MRSGDVWSMGAAPQVALAQVTLPRMSEALQARTLAEVMAAAAEVFGAAGADLVGGHSTMGAETVIGFTVTGLCDAPIGQDGARAGDAIVLTRPIGTGVVLAAEMAGAARGADVVAMLRTMQRPQGDAAAVLAGAHAMTDVTGFGLAGHLTAVCRASGVAAEISLEAVPVYDGAEDLAAAGHVSSLHGANVRGAPVTGGAGPGWRCCTIRRRRADCSRRCRRRRRRGWWRGCGRPGTRRRGSGRSSRARECAASSRRARWLRRRLGRGWRR